MTERMESPAALLWVRDGRTCVDDEDEDVDEDDDDERWDILKFALNRDDNLLFRFSGAPVPGSVDPPEPSSVPLSLRAEATP